MYVVCGDNSVCVFQTLETAVDEDELVFLYQLKEGICQSSYAANIATLAGLPTSIVQRAVEVYTHTHTHSLHTTHTHHPSTHTRLINDTMSQVVNYVLDTLLVKCWVRVNCYTAHIYVYYVIYCICEHEVYGKSKA